MIGYYDILEAAFRTSFYSGNSGVKTIPDVSCFICHELISKSALRLCDSCFKTHAKFNDLDEWAIIFGTKNGEGNWSLGNETWYHCEYPFLISKESLRRDGSAGYQGMRICVIPLVEKIPRFFKARRYRAAAKKLIKSGMAARTLLAKKLL